MPKVPTEANRWPRVSHNRMSTQKKKNARRKAPRRSPRCCARLRRASKAALHRLVLVKETLGDAWLTPDLFRFGASALLNDVLMQLEKERTGAYQASEDFSKD